MRFPPTGKMYCGPWEPPVTGSNAKMNILYVCDNRLAACSELPQYCLFTQAQHRQQGNQCHLPWLLPLLHIQGVKRNMAESPFKGFRVVPLSSFPPETCRRPSKLELPFGFHLKANPKRSLVESGSANPYQATPLPLVKVDAP